MDALSYQNTFIHGIDPRAKLITTMVFIAMAVSMGKYEVSAMIPFLIYPVYLIIEGRIPPAYLLKKIAYVSPFALMIAVFNPIFERDTHLIIFGTGISGGWLSFASIMLRFFLTVSAALAMIACTGFYKVCIGMSRLGVPQIFTVQLLFIYRYLFVLTEETGRMVRARSMRSFGNRGDLKNFSSIAGNLLLRTINRAQRIYLAMSCRGFDGRFKVMTPLSFGLKETAFTLLWTALFICFRVFNIPVLLGSAINDIISRIL